MGIFEKNFVKVQKDLGKENRKQLKAVGNDPDAAIQFALQTFIITLCAMDDFIKMLNCPQDQKDGIIDGIKNLKMEFVTLKNAKG